MLYLWLLITALLAVMGGVIGFRTTPTVITRYQCFNIPVPEHLFEWLDPIFEDMICYPIVSQASVWDRLSSGFSMSVIFVLAWVVFTLVVDKLTRSRIG